MKPFYAFLGAFTLVVLLSCGGSTDPLPEEEEQIEDPVVTTLIFPEDNTECQEGTIINDNQSRVLFQWNESEHTNSYEVHLENLDNGTESTHESNTDELQIVIERGTAYSWFVVSKSSATDETAESETWKFYNAGAGVVNHAPFPADLLSPTNNGTVVISSGSVLLDWEAYDIDNDIVSFEVFMDTNNPPTTSEGTTSETEMTLDVIANTTYYWFVEVVDSANNTSKSDVFKFSIE
ncbi:hypothetical protein [Maribacter sp. 2304DJ31-5]|uniref:hypothetical protein n=1 Tax=Maribacter sp. 2304DJ31-5 TaxID=3386273 RepID=UPI0039BD89C7